MKSGSFGEEIPKDFETSICVDAIVWELMISALTDLMQHGYDTAECETYLPMLEAHSIYPEMEHGLMMFYHHMKSRVTPEWRETEPEQVVTRALQFIRAYETIKNIK